MDRLTPTVLRKLFYTNCPTLNVLIKCCQKLSPRTVLHALPYIKCPVRTVLHRLSYFNCPSISRPTLVLVMTLRQSSPKRTEQYIGRWPNTTIQGRFDRLSSLVAIWEIGTSNFFSSFIFQVVQRPYF